MTLEVHRFNGDDYTRVATIYDDGTIDGTSQESNHFRDLFREIENEDPDVSNWIGVAKRVIQLRYNDGYYQTVTV